MKTPLTNLSSLEFVHVTRKGSSPVFVCAFGSNCGRTTVKVAKKTTKATLCVHEQIVQMLESKVNKTENQIPVGNPTSDFPQFPKDAESDDSQSVWLSNTASFIYENHRIDLTYSSLRSIVSEIMEIENSAEGFPNVYQVSINMLGSLNSKT